MPHEEQRDGASLPDQLCIRDKDIIAELEAERVDKGDTSITRTAVKILTKYFAQKPARQSAQAAQ